MADKNKIVDGNVEGDFFVDTSCINCDNCRDLAPEVFGRFGSYAGVKRQPETVDEVRRSLEALVCCPTGSIGTHEKHDLKDILAGFPQHIEGPVYYFGFNSKQGAGGKSYFIKHQSGNWMVDSPKYQPRLLKWIEENGGLKYIFLTHRDDVGEASQYAKHFACQRIIHQEDLEAQPEAEIVLQGISEISLEAGMVIIPTPGHTEGHCMLLVDDKYLFSGDVLTSHYRFDEIIETWPPFYCWWSWEEQTKSLTRLEKHCFEWLLPAHGRRVRATAEEMSQALHACIERSQQESDPNPCTPDRIAFFERIAAISEHFNQPLYAASMRQRAQKLKERAGLI